ncbi:hypothetical protein FVF75_08690 [Maritimibacter fusiformis]|uniref:Uncharacterized protein n=2 Tax=Maritimibacter fusiformis TaxID=2603819 RepID=A0A5D0RJU6_9RHOB|nr:hypothetical protein FVF75_08690 [Maritimibacter fusiformis]
MIWADCAKGDEAWQAEQKRIQDAANRARAEAAKAQHKVSKPWAGEGKPVDGDPTNCGATIVDSPEPKPDPKAKSGASERKAEAAGVTRKTVDMAEALTNKRPDLAEQVRAGKMTLSSATTRLANMRKEDTPVQNRSVNLPNGQA